MNKKYLNLAKKYAKTIEESGIKLQSLYLFGSVVKGKNKEWSDLDTCVVSKDFENDRISDRVNLMFLSRNISLEIEPHPFSVKEFNDKNNTLAQEIQKTGIRVI